MNLKKITSLLILLFINSIICFAYDWEGRYECIGYGVDEQETYNGIVEIQSTGDKIVI